MAKTHTYAVTLTWTGNTGTGTSGYGAFDRSSEVTAGDKATLLASADPAFRGAPERWNPEELLIASLSQCHMLWYLVLCAKDGIVVTHYVDHPSGTMVEDEDGGGHFEEVTLHPEVTIATGDRLDRARALHERAHDLCFVARSVNFEVRAEPTITTAATG
ncbi:MAG TPA: OsmC family protein [Candidatus Acidoferrales bacterium]|nr:OsmC family protein [Candidatus Acidoferrales bacterium]